MIARSATLMVFAILSSNLFAQSTTLPNVSQRVPSGFGVNIHFTHPRKGEMEQLAAAGFKFVRMDFSWDKTENKRGQYDWSAYEDLLKALKPHGIRAVFILDYINRLYDDNQSPHTDEGRAAFGKWAAAGVSHFKGRGIVWEMYNEPNIHPFWRPAPNTSDYIKLALTVGKALREAAPDEIYVGPACSTMDFPFLEDCFAGGVLEYFRAVSVHPYRGAPPETVAADYRRLRMLIEKDKPRGRSIPIFSGEWGYSSTNGISEEKQGQYLPRQGLTNISNDVPLSIWYDWHDDGPDPKETEHHFGTVHNDYSPKPAYEAVKKLTTELAGFKFNKRLWIDRDDDYVLLFDRDDEVKLAFWTTASPHTITLPAIDRSIDLTNDAQYIAAPQTDAIVKLAAWKRSPLETFVEAPQFIDGPNISITRGTEFVSFDIPSDVSPAIKQRMTFVVTNALKLSVQPTRGHGLVAQIDDPSGQPFSGFVTLGAAKVPVEIKGSRRSIIELPGGDSGVVELLDEKAGRVAQVPFRFVRLPLSVDDYIVRAEGDKEVKSTQSVAAGTSPEELKVIYAFDPGWKYVCLHPKTPVPIEGRPKSIGMWVTGDGSGNHLRLRVIDSTGQTFQPDVPGMKFKDRRFVEFDLGGSRMGHWGGANDGVIHWPIKLETLLLIDSADRGQTSGTVIVDSPAVIYGDSTATSKPR